MDRPLDAMGVAFVVIAAACFGLLGPLSRMAAEAGLAAPGFAAWRSWTSATALLVVLLAGMAVGRVQTIPPSAISRFQWLQMAAMGLLVAGTTLSLFLAFQRTTIAVALMVFYTFPLMVAVAAVPVYGEHLGRRRALAIALALVGLVLLLMGPESGDGAGPDGLGMLLASVAAFCQLGYALIGSRGFAAVPSFQAATIVRSFDALVYLLVIAPALVLLGEGGSLLEPVGSVDVWVLILVAGVLGASVPTTLLLAGYRRLGPTRGAILTLVEPVTGVLLAALLLAERPAPIQLLGGLLVLAGAALVQLTPSRGEAAAPPVAE